MVKKRRGQVHDAGPLMTDAVGRSVDEVAPRSNAFEHGEQVSDLGRFEGGSIDSGLVEQEGRIEEAVELEAAAAGEHGAQFGSALLLLVDPGEIGARL